MKFNFLQTQTSRREILRESATLAGSAFLAHFFPATLLRVSYAQHAPSAADLVAGMRAKFNAAPIQTQKLADNITKFSRLFLQDAGATPQFLPLEAPDWRSHLAR